MCKIALIENLSLYSSGIVLILNKLDGIDIVAEVKNVDELIQKTGRVIPDIIVFDTLQSENSGIKPLKKIRRNFPKTPLLIITSDDYADSFEEYIRIGVNGFVFGNAGPEELIKAIKKLKEGGEYFREDVWDLVKKTIRSHKNKTVKSDLLSERENSVLKLIAMGMTYKQIGLNLNISPRTVETHKNNILTKLNVRTKAEMIKYAYQNNILVQTGTGK